jgi:hypothetical protein
MNRKLLEAIRCSIVAFVGETEFGTSRPHRSGVSNDVALDRLLGVLESETSENSREWSDAECCAWSAARQVNWNL